MTPESLRDWCDERRMPAFRAAQIMEWVYAKGVADPLKMSNISKLDRETLARKMTFLSGETISHQSASDGTQKLLIQWDEWKSESVNSSLDSSITQAEEASRPSEPGLSLTVLSPHQTSHSNGDGHASNQSITPTIALSKEKLDSSRQTECVMIPVDQGEDQSGRRTACISSQVGCPVGCKFCASGLGGLDGNLSAGRIVEQVWRLGQLLQQQHDPIGRITNVVFMGMGEPLSNFAAVTSATRRIATLAPEGLGVSARKITISTVGLPKAIERLAAELDLPVTLALSLHAPNDELRRKLIPWAEYTTIPELLGACQKWFDKTGREITLEYIMLGGVNDQRQHAEELAILARTLRANVNLIRYNEVKGIEFARPTDQDVRSFQAVLRERNINVHIRASRGRDIAAACGQLRHESKLAQTPASGR